MLRVKLLLLVGVILVVAGPANAKADYSKYLFNIGGGIGFPQGDLTKFVNDGGNFVVGGGINFNHYFGMDSEYIAGTICLSTPRRSNSSRRPEQARGNTHGRLIQSSTFPSVQRRRQRT